MLKDKSIPNPLELLPNSEIADALDLTLEDCDYSETDALQNMFVRDYELKIEAARQQGFNADIERTIAKEYLSYFAEFKLIEYHQKLSGLTSRLLESMSQYKTYLASLSENNSQLLSNLEKQKQDVIKQQRKQEKQAHMQTGNDLRHHKIKLGQIHFAEYYDFIAGSPEQRLAGPYVRELKKLTSPDLEKKLKLSEKSLGHQYLLLIGAGVIEPSQKENDKGNQK